MIALIEDVPVHVNLDQVRSCDLVIPETVLVDEEPALLTRDARRDVVVDERRHAEMVGKAIGCSQVDPSLPLGIRIAVGRLLFVIADPSFVQSAA